MKNNKYAPYILGPVLIVLWGLIFYKIYQQVYSDTDNFIVPDYEALPLSDPAEEDSSYALLLDYKDPFLGKKTGGQNYRKSQQKTTGTKRTSNKKQEKTKQNNTTPPKPFPPITYQGLQIMQTDTCALLKIKSKFYPSVRRGQVYQGIRIAKIYKDSIELFYDGRSAVFKK